MSTTKRVNIDISIAIDLPDDRPVRDYARAALHHLLDQNERDQPHHVTSWPVGDVSLTVAQAASVTSSSPPAGHGATIAPQDRPLRYTMTFDELVAHGIAEGGNVVNGMPWSFNVWGFPVTHENDDLYLICRYSGDPLRMGRTDVLVLEGTQLSLQGSLL